MIRKFIFQIINILFFPFLFFIVFSCEGPQGLPGTDANQTCKLCHNPKVVDYYAAQFNVSVHATNNTAFEEMGTTACATCHESTGFTYVCVYNVPSTFTMSANGQYENNYVASDSTTYGAFTCFTCHSSIHTTYDTTDFFPLTSTAPVSMTMWAGTKTINLTQNSNRSNLCIKCHQPRPLTVSSSLSNGNVVDYANLVANPTVVCYDSAVGNASPNTFLPSYRTGVHNGTVGAIVAGVGGIEFPGSLAYANSSHASITSCEDCHMASITGSSGGHTFNAEGNFNGCNTAYCHANTPLSSTSGSVVFVKNEILDLIEELASKLQSGGIVFIHTDPTSTNLWMGKTPNNYDGNLNIYDPSLNPGGAFRNPAPANTWTPANIATNKTLPKFTSLTNVQLGAIINFQLCLREFSMGIHNYGYSRALLNNTIEALTAAGY